MALVIDNQLKNKKKNINKFFMIFNFKKHNTDLYNTLLIYLEIFFFIKN